MSHYWEGRETKGAYHLSELDGLIGLPANLTRQFCQSKRATHDLIALKKESV